MFSFTRHSLPVGFYQNWVLLPDALIRIFTHWSLARVHYKVPGAAVRQPIHHCPRTGSERLTGAAFLEIGEKDLCDKWHKLTGILLGINGRYLSSQKYCMSGCVLVRAFRPPRPPSLPLKRSLNTAVAH